MIITYKYYKNLKVKMFLGRRVIGEMLLIDREQPGAYISFLEIYPKHRNKGHGSIFLQEVERYLWENGCEGISLKCAVDNKNAQRFYKANGFFICALSHLGEKPYYWMAKQIN
jgi:ribosomal protein S18 acetylase RimI-like enzyme